MKSRRGLTLIEAVIAMLITTVILVAAMRATAAAVRLRSSTSARVTGQQLGDGLMNDIIALPYASPTTTPVFGVESGESTTSKAAWDDVDDFNGWSETPPQDRSGNSMTDLSGWKRVVKIERVATSDAATVSSIETGLKRVTVTVTKKNVVYCIRVALRGAAP